MSTLKNKNTIMKKITNNAIEQFAQECELDEDTQKAVLDMLQNALKEYDQQLPKSETKELLNKLSDSETPTRPVKKTTSGNAWSQFLKEQKPKDGKLDRAKAEADYKLLSDDEKAELKARSLASHTPKDSKPRTISAYNETQKYVKAQIEALGLKDTVKYADVIGDCWVPKSKMTFEQAKEQIDAYLGQHAQT